MNFKFATALATAVLACSAAHSETRELGAHQHGQGSLNIAFEGSVVAMELKAPGADIVGFEHPAKTAEDRTLIDAAIAQLAKPFDLFTIPTAAGCTVTAANVALIGDDEADHDHDHKDDHADHADGHDDHSDHADHADHADDHKDHADEHKDHADGHDAGHTEFHAEYALACDDPEAIDAIEFAYFELFPNAAELDIQLISDKGAKGFEVERDDPRLSLSGAI